MTININDSEFIDFCEIASQMEVAEKVIGGPARGLDKLALRALQGKKILPNIIMNLMVVYFFFSFANKVYHRNDLSQLYNYWANKRIFTLSQAKQMMEEDVHLMFERIKSPR
ncbi:hypothetical protein [Domibacillus tundrae]|uniref:hypothetical protein n=1 Tax=Domibacillus tundrae TaxID=1587527 RepID=UPI0033962B34